VSLAERESGGEGEEFVVIRGTARDTGFLHPTGAEEAAQGGIGADLQKVGGVAGGVAHGQSPFVGEFKFGFVAELCSAERYKILRYKI
jgi:hypothetical protein